MFTKLPPLLSMATGALCLLQKTPQPALQGEAVMGEGRGLHSKAHCLQGDIVARETDRHQKLSVLWNTPRGDTEEAEPNS